ncbi:hypothetical protein UY3_14761 [Chelonia mydas]|uniref:Uncharacterized protein n=1 Tax=Chelonia mydas TaxID=8469 RepID=M7ARZ0_CHEMY|nr:hypothetical protein UY3_14761 [Chelonia mydas]
MGAAGSRGQHIPRPTLLPAAPIGPAAANRGQLEPRLAKPADAAGRNQAASDPGFPLTTKGCGLKVQIIQLYENPNCSLLAQCPDTLTAGSSPELAAKAELTMW